MDEFFPFDWWPETRDSRIDEPGCPAGAGCILKGNNPDNCLIGCYLKREAETPKNRDPE